MKDQPQTSFIGIKDMTKNILGRRSPIGIKGMENFCCLTETKFCMSEIPTFLFSLGASLQLEEPTHKSHKDDNCRSHDKYP